MIINPFTCENCNNELQPEDIGVDFKDGKLIRICGFCGNIVKIEEKINKVNLDLEFEKWKKENEEHLKEHFLDTHNFYNYLEEEWQIYQRENNLFDISNEDIN